MVSADAPLYSERLWPGGVVWGTTVFFAVAVGIAILPASLPVAVGAAGVVLALGVFLAWITTPVVTVTTSELRAGRARIPLTHLGDPEELNALATRAALGPDLDARAYLCLRAWIRTAVRVSVTDPRDPTPYWFISTRRPAALASALREAGGTPTADPPVQG